jgi:uncharacterized membrane protein
MNLRPLAIAGVVTVGLMLGMAAWAWAQIPPGALVPVHWGIDGQPDGYASKELALLFIPGLTVFIAGLLFLLPRFEPRADNLARSGPAYVQVSIAVLVVMVAVQLTVVLAAIGSPLGVNIVLGVAIGVLLIVIGNVMGKVRSNFIFGVRTPWTLSSDLSWNKTHRLVGRLFVLLGLAMIVVGLIGGMTAFFAVALGGIALIVIVAFVYSYRVWKSDPAKLKVGERTQPGANDGLR